MLETMLKPALKVAAAQVKARIAMAGEDTVTGELADTAYDMIQSLPEDERRIVRAIVSKLAFAVGGVPQ